MKHFRNPSWSSLAINGFIAIVIGLVFVFLPEALVTTIVKIIGAILVASGIIILLFNFIRRRNGVYNVYYIFQGILNVAVGIVMFTNPQLMVDFIFFIIGLWVVAIGLFQMIYALRINKTLRSGMVLLGNGIAFLVLGLVMIFNPEAVINTMLFLIGAIIAILGFVLLYFSFVVYKSNKLTSSKEITDAEIID